MTSFIDSGRIIDLILGLTVLEAIALVVLHRLRGRGVDPREFAANLLSGCLLLLAMRAYVSGAGWIWIATSLLLAGVAHSVDMARRWRWKQEGRPAAPLN